MTTKKMKQRKAKTAKEVLIAARWMIENVGWTKGKYFGCKGKDVYFTGSVDGCDEVARGMVAAECFCGEGAVYCTVSDISKKIAAICALHDAAKELSEGRYGYFPSFNDDFCTSKEDVLKAFDVAIASFK